MAYSKFNAAETVLGILFSLLIDGLAAILDLVPIIGKITAPVIQAGVSFGTTLWLMAKGGKKATSLERQLVKHLANFLPFVPTLTIGFAIEVALHNNPRIAEKVKKVAVPKLKAVGVGGVFIALGAASLMIIAPMAHAQEELNLVFTWQVDSFYPSNYLMKAPATPNSPLTISLAALENGRFIDLSSTEIVWYRDGKYLNNGVGLTRVTFPVDWRVAPPGSDYSVRALVYYPDGVAESTVHVPIEQQGVVLDIPRFGYEAPSGSQTAITAIPFFFNVNDFGALRFEWNVEDTTRSDKTEENVLVLNVGALQATRRYIPISVRVTNDKGLIEWAEKRVNILIQ